MPWIDRCFEKGYVTSSSREWNEQDETLIRKAVMSEAWEQAQAVIGSVGIVLPLRETRPGAHYLKSFATADKNGNGKRHGSPARNGDYYSPSGSVGPASNNKKAKVIHTYGVPGSGKARGVYLILLTDKLPRHEGEDVLSEDAEGEDDDAEGEGDEEYANGGLSPAGVSGDDEDWQGSSMSED
ncbi:hypothetical protein QFC19_001071 [Naganishia cerealis]|uniref:Uncharacterized protein n=1 Tax=Naganishia cerealis TaxID=610337 RepID=A0ACC2WJV7_9TREE|nr:hypothetical protein QFC19_001071 [Naganishia cerealis]